MPKAFEGVVSSRSSISPAGPPGERVILELNPERREKILEVTSWPSLYPGTLNLAVDNAVLELLRESETVWVEDARQVRYPDRWEHIPKLRKAWLYYQGIVQSGSFSIDVLIRRSENPVPERVELFSSESIRSALGVKDGDRIRIELDNSGEILQEMKQQWREERRFFSNQGKEDRERWVVAEFLRLRGIEFEEAELYSPEQAHSTDVVFRNAKFQVKELTLPDIRRQDEMNEIYRRVDGAKRLEDTIGPAFAYDVAPAVAGDAFVYQALVELSRDPRYLPSKSMTDLLFYVTNSRASLPASWRTDWTTLSQFGWRSVSCLIKNDALVLFATGSAPEFLRAG